MARDVESLVLQMSADLRRFEKSMAQMDATARKRLTAVEAQALKSQKNLERTMGRAGDGMVNALRSSLSELAPTLAAAFSTAAVVQYADAWTNGRNALAAAGVATEDLGRRQEELVDLANETRSSTEQTIGLYRRLTIATQEMGMSQGDALRLTELLNKSFQTSGSSTQEAASAALQLSQALASGVLQGDELRSIRENAPQLAQAIAKSMGVGIGELKKLGAEGKITAQVVASAILGAGDQIEAKFAATSVTVSQSLQVLDNQLGRYIGQQDAGLSATQRAAAGIVLLANNLDTILPIVGALATFIGTRYAGALAVSSVQMAVAGVNAARLTLFNIGMTASMTGATRAQVALNLAMAANPVGFVITLVAALSAGLFLLATRYSSAAVAARELDGVVAAADTQVGIYAAAVLKARDASGENRAALLKEAEAQRILTAARIADARVIAQKRIDEAVASRRVADRNIQQLSTRRAGVNDRSFSNASTSQDIGQAAQTQAAINSATRDRQEANEALASVRRLEESARAAANPVVAGGGGGKPPGDDKSGKGKKDSGPTPEELAAQRETLRLQGQAEVLKAQGRDADAAAIQRQIDILNLTKTFKDAEVKDAEKAATAQVDALANAEAAARGRQTAVERTKALLDMAAEAQQRNADLAEDELGFRIEIARLLGDEAGVVAAQREYDIARRTADLKAKGAVDPKGQATKEIDELRGAEIVGGLGDGFKDPLEQMREVYAEVERLRQADVLSEQEAAAAKAQADALYQEQRLANASSFFSTLAELQNSSNKELAAIGKAAAIVQATMDGYVAVQKALASAPPPFNYIQAAAVGVVAAANVAKIAGMADGGLVRGPGGPREDKVLRRLSAGEFVVNASATSQNRALLEAINSGTVRLPSIPSAASLPGTSNQSISLSMPIDARGADMGAAQHIARTVGDLERRLPGIIKGVTGRQARYRLGQNADA